MPDSASPRKIVPMAVKISSLGARGAKFWLHGGGGLCGRMSNRKPGGRIGNPESEISETESETKKSNRKPPGNESETKRQTNRKPAKRESETKPRIRNQWKTENDLETTRETSRKPTNIESETLDPIRKPAGSDLETLAKL